MDSTSFITGLDSLYRNDSDETTSGDSSRDAYGRKWAPLEQGRDTAAPGTNHKNRPVADIPKPCTGKRHTAH